MAELRARVTCLGAVAGGTGMAAVTDPGRD
jgi:hypothetical protein